MTELLPEKDFELEIKNNKRFKQIFDDLEAVYKAAFSDDLKIEPDSYGGFCLRNGSKRIKVGEIQSSVGLLVKIPPEKDFGNWSVMEGEKLLVDVARWANHSCRPNCDFYMKRGFRGRPCVRLRALRYISPGDELCTYYNDDVFGLGNCDCLCKYLHSQKPESSSFSSERKRRMVRRFKSVRDTQPSNL